MFLRRSHRGPDPHLEWKVRIFAIGAGLGIAGIFLELAWLVIAALVILASGVLLRFRSRGDDTAQGEEEGPAGGE